ncbi:MAG: amidohydrolase, partial [Gemmatimonadales bacterium]
IKLYSSLKPELVPVAAERAHARGLRLSGHIPAHMLARDAVLQGYDEIQHINMVVLNFLSDTLDTRTPVRFIEPGKQAANLDISSDSVQAFFQFLVERNIVVDPTLATFEGLLTARPGQMAEGDARMARHLPSQVGRGLLGGGLPADDDLARQYRASYRQMLALVKAMHDAGVQLVAGTDCMAGFCLQRELELYSEAGIPNADVLRIATIEAARVAGRADRLGSVRPGKLADLVLIDGNPLVDMSQIRRVSLVMKDGVLYAPAAVQRTLGITPWQSLRPSP